MKYDFTTIMDRHGMDAIAVDGLSETDREVRRKPKEGFDIIPMWVADMNFATVPTVQEAIAERVKHPAFGYFDPREEYFQEIIDWQTKRNGVEGLTAEAIGYENGVLGGVLSTLQAFASPGDAVLLHSPTYIGFTGSIGNYGYKMVHSPLKKMRKESGEWIMKIWMRRSKSIISMWQSSVIPITRVAGYGNAGRLKKRWKYIRPMTAWLSPMRSGRI